VEENQSEGHSVEPSDLEATSRVAPTSREDPKKDVQGLNEKIERSREELERLMKEIAKLQKEKQERY